MIASEDDGFPPDRAAGWRDFAISVVVGFVLVSLMIWGARWV